MGLDRFIESSKDYSIGQVSSSEVSIDELSLDVHGWERWIAYHPTLAVELARNTDKEGKKQVINHIDRIIQDQAYEVDVQDSQKSELEERREEIVDEIKS